MSEQFKPQSIQNRLIAMNAIALFLINTFGEAVIFTGSYSFYLRGMPEHIVPNDIDILIPFKNRSKEEDELYTYLNKSVFNSVGYNNGTIDCLKASINNIPIHLIDNTDPSFETIDCGAIKVNVASLDYVLAKKFQVTPEKYVNDTKRYIKALLAVQKPVRII